MERKAANGGLPGLCVHPIVIPWFFSIIMVVPFVSFLVFCPLGACCSSSQQASQKARCSLGGKNRVGPRSPSSCERSPQRKGRTRWTFLHAGAAISRSTRAGLHA